MSKRLSVIDSERCVGCQSCMFACVRRQGEGGLADARITVRSAGGIERGFVVIVCRACPDPQCMKVCPADALKPRTGGGVTLVAEKCLGCGACVEACPLGAVFWDDDTNKPAICVHCGFCADHCPHAVLALEERVGEGLCTLPGRGAPEDRGRERSPAPTSDSGDGKEAQHAS